MPEMSPNVPTRDAANDAATRTQPPSETAQIASVGPMPSAPAGYLLREELGRGGMGIVYRAHELALDREVAVKLLSHSYAPDSAAARRFLGEAQITGQLQHPSIPPVHQAGTTPDGRPFLAMKLVKGRTLAELLDKRDKPSADRSRFLAIFEHVCHAVGYAHAHAVIHRDLKPSNIMVGAFGEVQVMDWGLAKVATDGGVPEAASSTDKVAELTRTAIGTNRIGGLTTETGLLLGTPAFMSPEQAGGEVDKIGPRSDVFGLGAILCVILTGLPPYRGPSAEAVHLQAIRGQLEDAFARLDASDADPEIVALAKRCLAGLAERPAHASEVAEAVARLRAASEERARQAERMRAEAEIRAAELRKRRKVWFGLAAALLVGAAASVAFAVRARHAENQAIEQRDLKETARAEAEANADRARAAESARRLELGKTAAAAAQLAAGRGRWEEALKLYETALALGGENEIELKLERFDCRLALGQLKSALDELDELAARPDLGRFAGRVLLRKADQAITLQAGRDPRELARQAIAKGLPPADAAYAQVFLAQTAPEAIQHLQDAMRLDPFHSRGLDWLGTLLFITGRKSELRDVVTQLRLSRPDSANQLMGELILCALDSDSASMERVLARLGETGYKDWLPFFRSFADFIIQAQSEEFFFKPPQPQQFLSFLSEYSKMAQRMSALAGEPNARDARIDDMRLFQLPMFQAMAEIPSVKGLTASGVLGTLATLKQPAKMAEILGGVAQAIPDGTFFMLRGMYLQGAGQFSEAEAVLRRAVESPSWANHRRAARYHLARMQWLLAQSPQTPTKEQLAWKEKALTNARQLAFSGSLPPEQTLFMVNIASGAGDPVLALTLAESGLRQEPDHPRLLDWKLSLETRLTALDRAEATALKYVGRAMVDQPTADLNTLLNLARVYQSAGRNTDALRWCDVVHAQLKRSGANSTASLNTWDRLGVMYWQIKQFDKSIPIFEMIWAAQRKAKGDLNPATLQTEINLGVNYRDAGRLKDAIPLLEQAEREGRGQMSLQWGRGELLSAYIQAGKTVEGTALAKGIEAAARKEHPSGSPQLAAVLAQCGHSLVQLKAWAEAEPVLREALTIREKTESDVWTTFNAKSLLGEALLGQKKYADAEPLLVQGYEGMKKRAAKIPERFRTTRLTEAVERIVQFNEFQGRKGEAMKWHRELDALRKP